MPPNATEPHHHVPKALGRCPLVVLREECVSKTHEWNPKPRRCHFVVALGSGVYVLEVKRVVLAELLEPPGCHGGVPGEQLQPQHVWHNDVASAVECRASQLQNTLLHSVLGFARGKTTRQAIRGVLHDDKVDDLLLTVQCLVVALQMGLEVRGGGRAGTHV